MPRIVAACSHFRCKLRPQPEPERLEGEFLRDVHQHAPARVEHPFECGPGARGLEPVGIRPQLLESIRIEDDAQIHSKCTIVNSIGHRSVIGANAVVSREIPPYCLAAGVPARVIDYFGPPGQEPPGWEPRERSEPEPAEAAD